MKKFLLLSAFLLFGCKSSDEPKKFSYQNIRDAKVSCEILIEEDDCEEIKKKEVSYIPMIIMMVIILATISIIIYIPSGQI